MGFLKRCLVRKAAGCPCKRSSEPHWSNTVTANKLKIMTIGAIITEASCSVSEWSVPVAYKMMGRPTNTPLPRKLPWMKAPALAGVRRWARPSSQAMQRVRRVAIKKRLTIRIVVPNSN